MDPGLLRDVLTVLLGVATGALPGMFGVGGAVISTPGIRALGVPAIVAVGTTLPSIIPGAAAGTVRYVRERLIDGRVVAWTAPTGIVAAVGGSLLSKVVPGDGHLLMILTAVLLGWSAVRMYRSDRTPAPVPSGAMSSGPDSAPHPDGSPWRYAAVGAVAGLLSGLLGIGGGIVMVPGFVQLAGLGVKQAIATSLACVAIFAVPGTITHALLGNIDWHFALLLALGVIPGARLGAALTVRTADHRLRVIVAVFLGATAVLYGVGELLALSG